MPPYSFPDTTVAPDTAYLYMVRAVNGVGVSLDSAADFATTTVFSNDPLAANLTLVDADHLSQVRDATNNVRRLAGLSPVVFSDNALPGVLVRAVHVTDVRSALNGALDALGFAAASYTEIPATGTKLKAQHFQEIRERLR